MPENPNYPDLPLNYFKSTRISKDFLIAFIVLTLIALLVGVSLGYTVFNIDLGKSVENSQSSKITVQNSKQSFSTNNTPPTKKISALQLPKNVVKIYDCVDHQGSIYIQPNDIPNGPFFMVYNGSVIGLEFIDKEVDSGEQKNFQLDPVFHIPVDHLVTNTKEINKASQEKPRTKIDLYFVSPEIEKAIECQN